MNSAEVEHRLEDKVRYTCHLNLRRCHLSSIQVFYKVWRRILTFP